MMVMRRPCDGCRGFSAGRRTAQCKFSLQARLAHEIGFGRQSHDLLHGERPGPASGSPAAADAALGVQRHAMVPRQREQPEPGDIGDGARPLGQLRRLRLSRSCYRLARLQRMCPREAATPQQRRTSSDGATTEWERIIGVAWPGYGGCSHSKSRVRNRACITAQAMDAAGNVSAASAALRPTPGRGPASMAPPAPSCR
jgi:hypothetical protein